MPNKIKKRTVALLTIYYEGMELRLVNRKDDVIRNKKQFMGMMFNPIEDKIGHYIVEFPYNKMISILITKFQTQEFDTKLEYCKEDNLEKIISCSEQKSTLIKLIVKSQILPEE